MKMNEKDIKNFLHNGEKINIEFKESFGKEAIQTTGALANTSGGYLLIGVDKKGNIKGATLSNETLKNWGNRISQLSEPTLIPTLQSFDVDGKTIVLISIKEFPLKPVAINGRCYKRVGASNKVLTPAEITELHLHSTGSSMDAIAYNDATLKDIDTEKVRDYIKKAKSTGRRDFNDTQNVQGLLRKLDLIKDNVPTWAAIVAFGSRSPFQAKVKCGRIRGTSTIVDDYVVDAPLLNQVDEVMGYMKRTLQLSYEISGKAQRDEIWEYPLDAIREIITNAICHRDYTSSAEIQIKIFDERMVIFNPGALPIGMTVKRLLDPNHNSIPRNRLIAMLFYDTGMIERYGSGIQRILDDCRNHGFPTPEFKELEYGFQVTLYKDIYTEQQLSKNGLNKRQIKAVIHVKERGRITNKDYQMICNISERTATRELSDLVCKDIFDKIGTTGRGTEYTLRSQNDAKGAKKKPE